MAIVFSVFAMKREGGEETKTSIDSLLELLRERGKCELSSVSVQLGVGAAVLEQWAKVLESGKLIKVSYELGKMYMEPLNIESDQMEETKSRTAAQKTTMDNQIDMSRLSLDKFAKNLEGLDSEVNSLDAAYRQRLPKLHQMFDELDHMYTPIEQKLRALAEVKKSSDDYIKQLDSRMDGLYSKMQLLESGNFDKVLKEKVVELEKAQEKAIETQESMKKLDETKRAFQQNMEAEIDQRVKELKKALKKSVDDIYDNVKAESMGVDPIMRSIKEQLSQAGKIAGDANEMRKEAQVIEHTLSTTRSSFKDRYSKMLGEIESSSSAFALKYEAVEREISSLKNSVNDASKLDGFIKSAKRDLSSISMMIEQQKKEVNEITIQLRELNRAKDLSMDRRARAVEEIKKKTDEIESKNREIDSALSKADKNLKEPKMDEDK